MRLYKNKKLMVAVDDNLQSWTKITDNPNSIFNNSDKYTPKGYVIKIKKDFCICRVGFETTPVMELYYVGVFYNEDDLKKLIPENFV